MTFEIKTVEGPFKITPPHEISSALRQKIEKNLKKLIDKEETEIEPIKTLLKQIKKRISWVDSPRGKLIAYKTKNDWTQLELAKRSDIPQGDLSKMLNGKKRISIGAAKKLGKAFNTEYQNFL